MFNVWPVLSFHFGKAFYWFLHFLFVFTIWFYAANIIFNPLTYGMIALVGWRSTYWVLALMVLVVGCATAATFRPLDESSKSDQLIESYQDILSSNTSANSRNKYVMFPLWFVASLAKGIGYYTPILILVRINNCYFLTCIFKLSKSIDLCAFYVYFIERFFILI